MNAAWLAFGAPPDPGFRSLWSHAQPETMRDLRERSYRPVRRVPTQPRVRDQCPDVR